MYKEEDLESDVIELLKSLDINMAIMSYQNDLESFTNIHETGSILVSYAGTSPIIQGHQEYDEVSIGIDVIYKNILTHIGAFEVMRQIRDAMKSLDYVLKSKVFLDIDGDEWHYSMSFTKQLIYQPEI